MGALPSGTRRAVSADDARAVLNISSARSLRDGEAQNRRKFYENAVPKMNENKKTRRNRGQTSRVCALRLALPCSGCRQMRLLREKWDIVPILRQAAAQTDTRFGSAEELRRTVAEICGREPILTVERAEPLGPSDPLDMLLIAPCTGNTLARLAHGVTDTSVTMAAKAHLRRGRPLVIALASNDALSGGFVNFAAMAQRKCVYFVPLSQDDPQNKPNSLVADFSLIPQALEDAAAGRQSQPMLLAPGI